MPLTVYFNDFIIMLDFIIRLSNDFIIKSLYKDSTNNSSELANLFKMIYYSSAFFNIFFFKG